MWYTKNCSAYSRHWSIGRAQFFSKRMPDGRLHNHCFKSWTNQASKFCLICHIHLTSHQLTTTSSSILTTFCKENASITTRIQCFPTFCWILKHGFLHYRNKQTFLISKNVLIVMVPILTNEDMFEPSYNDLKFMIWNCNYICTNLIEKWKLR